MNTEQFGAPSGPAYIGVKGADGMLRPQPLVDGTVIRTVNGHRIYTQGEWKPLEYDWVMDKDGKMVRVVPPMSYIPDDQPSWSPKLTDDEVKQLMEKMQPTPEAIAALIEKLNEPEREKFHFTGF